MNKYLFMLDELPPTISANGICAEKVMNKLLDRGEVYCITWDCGKKDSHDKFKCSFISKKPWTRIANKFSNKNNPVFRVLFLLLRGFYFIKRIIYIPFWPIDSLTCVNKYYNKAKEIIEKEDITHVVAISFPGETLLAMKRLKRRFKDRIKTVMYPLDVTLNGAHNKKGLMKMLTKLGCKHLFKNCGMYADGIMVLENAREIFEKTFPECIRKKFIYVGIPLIEEIDCTGYHILNNSKEIHIIFGGTLIYGLRNPTVLFDAFEKISNSDDLDIIIDLYGKIDERLIDIWDNRYNKLKIVRHGWVTEEQLNIAISNSDLLLNIGNSEKYLIPSKVFKYINTQKPILHLCLTKDDPCIPYLREYGNSFVYDINNNSAIIDSITEFFLSSARFEKSVGELFPTCTPEFTANKLETL